MNAKWLLLPGAALLLAGCDGVVVVDRRYHRPPPVAVYAPAPAVVVQPGPPGYQPAPPPPGYTPAPGQPVPAPPPGAVVAQPAPTYVEEGATVGGVVVTEPVGVDYVFIGGGWYYWHPGFHVWVHAIRPRGFVPHGGRVFHSWGEHPMYHR